MLRRLRRNCPVPRIRVRAPSMARPSPKKSEPPVEPTWRLAAFARAPALSTTRSREIRLTPVLTHESRVRSLARCSRISVWPCSAPLFSSLTRSDLPLKTTRWSAGTFDRRRTLCHRAKARSSLRGVEFFPQNIDNKLYRLGIRVSEGDRLLDRRAGLEQDSFLVEEPGRTSKRA